MSTHRLWLAALAAAVVLPQAQADVQVPSSRRFQEAAARVTPGLEGDLAAVGLSLGRPVFMRIFKEEKVLEVWLEKDRRFVLFRTYPICTFSGDLGPKEKQGDGQAPEGFYWVGPRQMNPYSQFHLSFDLGYPNAYDRAYRRTGSALMVHGNCVSIGCYAMTDAGIEEIYTLADAALRGGQPFFRVHAFPFRMSGQNLERHAGSTWLDFWRNLAEGYARFEADGRPPDAGVREKRYVFGP